MATERDFITPAGATVLDTANVVGSTTSTDYLSNTQRATVYPELQLNFAKAGVLDPRVTFSRASIGTFTNRFGYIQTADVNVPRFEYANGVCQGLLIEESRTNFFLNESNLNLSRRVAGSATGPDGKAAYAVILDKGYQNYNAIGGGGNQFFSIANGATLDWHFTGYLAALPNSGQELTADITFGLDVNNNGTSVIYCEWVFNPRTGTTVNRYVAAQCTELYSTIEVHPCGMYKLSWGIRYTQDSAGRNYLGTGIQVRDSNGTGQFISDGISGIQYACCQVEIGNQPTSYIPTGTSTVTRAADYAYVVADKFNFDPKQGAFLIRAKSNKVTTTSLQGGNDAAVLFNLLDSWDTNQNNELAIWRTNVGYSLQTFHVVQGRSGYKYSSIPSANLSMQPNTFTTAAVSYFSNTMFIMSANGIIGDANNYYQPVGNQTVPTQTIINLGNGYNFTQRSLNGTIAKFVYYSTPLSNTQMQGLTS